MKKIIKLSLILLISFFCYSNVFAFKCSAISDVEIDNQLAIIIKYVIIILQFLVPLLLVILGMVDFLKALTSQKEDEIKKGQQVFIKRLIAGVIVFFVIAVVKFVISSIAGNDSEGIMNCVDCFIKGPDSESCS